MILAFERIRFIIFGTFLKSEEHIGQDGCSGFVACVVLLAEGQRRGRGGGAGEAGESGEGVVAVRNAAALRTIHPHGGVFILLRQPTLPLPVRWVGVLWLLT